MPILGVVASSYLADPGPVGGYDALASVTVPSGGISSVVFAGIPAGYRHLQIRAVHRSTAGSGDGTVYMQMNGDTGSNYSFHRIYGYGTGSPGADASVSSTVCAIGQAQGASSALPLSYATMIVDVLDYASPSKNKTVNAIAGSSLNNNAGEAFFFNSSCWRNTAPVNSLSITSNQTGFAQYSSFALYGVK
jgi:hypothetical protein